MINIREIKSTVPVENDLKEKRIRLVFIKMTKRNGKEKRYFPPMVKSAAKTKER